MKAVMMFRSGESLHLETVADPEPGPGQILIRVEACGLCRTDLHMAEVAAFDNRDIYAFTRPGDQEAQKLALSLGCSWAGS